MTHVLHAAGISNNENVLCGGKERKMVNLKLGEDI